MEDYYKIQDKLAYLTSQVINLLLLCGSNHSCRYPELAQNRQFLQSSGVGHEMKLDNFDKLDPDGQNAFLLGNNNLSQHPSSLWLDRLRLAPLQLSENMIKIPLKIQGSWWIPLMTMVVLRKRTYLKVLCPVYWSQKNNSSHTTLQKELEVHQSVWRCLVVRSLSAKFIQHLKPPVNEACCF